MYIVSIDNYAYVVPFIEDEKKKFLKTIFPSRRMTQKYIIRKEKSPGIQEMGLGGLGCGFGCRSCLGCLEQ